MRNGRTLISADLPDQIGNDDIFFIFFFGGGGEGGGGGGVA